MRINIVYTVDGSRYIHPRQATSYKEAHNLLVDMRKAGFTAWAEKVQGTETCASPECECMGFGHNRKTH